MTFSHGFALIIGVDTYRNAPEINVPIAAIDAAAVADMLQDSEYCGYPPNQVISLTGSDTSKKSILHALDQLAQQTNPESTVSMFYCGHGDYDNEGSYNLICNDSQVTGGKVLHGTGITQQELLEKIKAIPAQRLLMIVNSCHSGEISPSLDLTRSLGGKNLPTMTMDALLSAGQGRVVITACREEQKSWIGKGKRSIFTQALIDCLQGRGIVPKGGYISLFDLYTGLYETVKNTVNLQLSLEQEPELTILKGVGPFAVALYKGSSETNLGVAEAAAQPPVGPAIRAIEPDHSRQLYQQMVRQTGGINIGLGNQVEIKGDVTGGNRIDTRNAQGSIHDATGPVEQQFGNRVDTGGGAYIGGNVQVTSGDFVGRDKITNRITHPENSGREEFIALLDQLRAELKQTPVEPKISAMIENEISSVANEAQDEKPSLPIIEAKLTSIQNVVQKTAGVAASSIGLAKIIQQIIGLAQSIF